MNGVEMTETVNHERYGVGVIEGERYQGFELLVHFASGIKKWVRRSELKRSARQDNSPIMASKLISADTVRPEFSGKTTLFQNEGLNGITSTLSRPAQIDTIGMHETKVDPVTISGSTQSIRAAEIYAPPVHAGVSNLPEDVLTRVSQFPSHTSADCEVSSRSDDETHESRVIIEALRLGGVPHEMVEQFTAGRDEELQRIQEWLASNEGCLLIDGDYGVGKSHILELTASHALHDGWVVARVEMDPQETPFHKPKQLYQKIVKSLEYYSDGRIRDFKDFMTFVVESPYSSKVQTLETHPYFATFIQNWRSDTGNEDLWSWIIGDSGLTRGFFPRLLDYQSATNIYCNLLSGLGWIAKNILDLKGFLILIDEAESIDKSFYSAYQHKSAVNTLNGLILMANVKQSLVRESSQENAIDYLIGKGHFGHYSGLRYPGDKRHQFPYLWKKDPNIKIAFAFVPEFFESLGFAPDLTPAVKEIPSLKIESLSRVDHAFLLKRITDIYQEAYHFTPQKNVFNLLPQQKTRIFVKAAVEALDLMRFHPDKDVQDLVTHDYDE